MLRLTHTTASTLLAALLLFATDAEARRIAGAQNSTDATPAPSDLPEGDAATDDDDDEEMESSDSEEDDADEDDGEADDADTDARGDDGEEATAAAAEEDAEEGAEEEGTDEDPVDAPSDAAADGDAPPAPFGAQPTPATDAAPGLAPAPADCVADSTGKLPEGCEAPARLDDKAAQAQEDETRPFGFFQDIMNGVGDDSDNPGAYRIMPFATLIGGGHYDWVLRRPEDDTDERESRFSTIAMGRVGMLATVGKFVTLESEIEMNAGPFGTSVWEGQAAIQVRNQLIRLTFDDLLYADRLTIEAGRITDPTSLNFFSMQAANMLLSDAIARAPILQAGFNRGNGVQVRYTLFDQVTVGLNVNAGNPTSTTGTLQVGGTFPPFSRFYEVPQAAVGRDARGFPTSSFHVMLASPSIRYEWRFIKAQASAQFISANTNTNSEKDENILGMNLRAGAMLIPVEDLFWDNRVAVFANISRIGNGVVDPNDLGAIQPGYFEAYTGSVGFDVDVWGRSGFGGEISVVRDVEPNATPAIEMYANAGATWWFTNTTSVSGRVAWNQGCVDLDCAQDGRAGFYVTLRTILGASPKTQP